MRRRLALLSLGFLAACGVKGRPIAPQLVVPDPPGSLVAQATPDGVRLEWRRPQRYSGGKRLEDLDGFVIERAPAEVEPPAWEEIGEVTVEDRDRFRKNQRFEYLDREVAPEARYRYRVTTRTLDDYLSAPAGPVTIRFRPPGAAR